MLQQLTHTEAVARRQHNMATVVIDEGAIQGGDTAPNPPTSLTTETEWDGVRLHWTNPSNKDIAYIEVWRSTTNDRSTATMVAEVKANDYTDHSLEIGTRYYWVRAMSTTGLESTWHPTSATAGVSGIPEQVAITSAADKDVLQYDSATNSWVNSHGIRANTRMLGELQATTDADYTFPPQTLNTVTDNNGYSAVSSFPAGTNGYGANMTYTHFYGDTLAANQTAPALQMRVANGNSVSGKTIPFSGLTSTAASAIASGSTMGTLNFNGHSTTGFSNEIATSNQGGGITALHALQVQGYAAEAFSDAVVTLTSTNVTAVASSFRATLSGLSITGTKGQLQYSGTQGAVGHAIRVPSGVTIGGTGSGITANTNYYIIAYSNDGVNSTAQLSLTPGGSPITTTAGTLTVSGGSITRCGVTFTMSGLSNVPFGRGAKVTVTGVTNVTDGTYPVAGTPTTTSMLLGIPHATAPSVAGAQTFACRTTYNGAGLRVRTYPLATPVNLQNRVELIDHQLAAATYKADTITLQQGTTTTNHLVLDTAKASFTKPVAFPTMDTTARNALTPAAGWVIFNTTTVKLECYDGTTWQALF